MDLSCQRIKLIILKAIQIDVCFVFHQHRNTHWQHVPVVICGLINYNETVLTLIR